jgi:DNA repair protein RadC
MLRSNSDSAKNLNALKMNWELGSLYIFPNSFLGKKKLKKPNTIIHKKWSTYFSIRQLGQTKKYKLSELHTIRSSNDSAQLFRKIFNADTFGWTEEMILLCLNRANKVIGFYKVSSGGFAGTVADPKVIFTIALNCAASAIIIAHNHPSGNLKASKADIDLTNKIKLAGNTLEINLLDHIIMTEDSYYSFADDALI